MNKIVALLLLTVLVLTVVPISEVESKPKFCSKDTDCQSECMTVKYCKGGTCYCQHNGK
uniref:AKTx n=1 Tax=Centruroides hentzi TaxID=88313 RepID=A0A2I9LNP2_9SCOR